MALPRHQSFGMSGSYAIIEEGGSTSGQHHENRGHGGWATFYVVTVYHRILRSRQFLVNIGTVTAGALSHCSA